MIEYIIIFCILAAVIWTLMYLGYFDFWESVGIEIFGRDGFLWWDSDELGAVIGIGIPFIIFGIYALRRDKKTEEMLAQADEEIVEADEEKKSTIFKCPTCRRQYKVKNNFVNHLRDKHKFTGKPDDFQDFLIKEKEKQEEKQKYLSQFKIIYFKITIPHSSTNINNMILWFNDVKIRDFIYQNKFISNYAEYDSDASPKNLVLLFKVWYHKENILSYRTKQKNNNSLSELDLDFFGSFEIRDNNQLDSEGFKIDLPKNKVTLHHKKPEVPEIEYFYTIFKIVFDIEYDPDIIDPGYLYIRTNRQQKYKEILNTQLCALKPKNPSWIKERRICVGDMEVQKPVVDKIKDFNYVEMRIVDKTENYFITNYLEKKINVNPALIDLNRDIEKYGNRIPINHKNEEGDIEHPYGYGSGFIISKSGLIVTNHHVVGGYENNPSKIEVRFSGDDNLYQVKIISKDLNNDLAVLKIAEESLPKIFNKKIPYNINQMNPVKSGQAIYTIGYPLSDIMGQKPRMTNGTVSSPFGLDDDPTIFQLSCPIQSGNSGGPVFNTKGELSGVIKASIDDQAILELDGSLPQNVNFAIKSSYISNLLDIKDQDLIKNKGFFTDLPLEEQVSHIEPFTCQIISYI